MGDVENSGQGWLLIIFERIAVTYPSYYEAMKPLLAELKSSGGLQISTQAEVINETFVRGQCIVSGKSKPWVIQNLEHLFHGLLTVMRGKGYVLLITHPSKTGTLTNVFIKSPVYFLTL